MRRIVTLAAGITLALTVSAQTAQNLTVPRPQAPGIEYSVGKMDNTIKPAGFKQMGRQKMMAAPKLHTAPRAPRLKESAADITTKDTVLVTGHKIKTLSADYLSETITYDKYGRRSTYASYDDDGSVRSEKKYTYEVGPFNYWTSKLVQIKDSETKTWMDYEKEEREIDENKNITHKKTYTRREKNEYDETLGEYVKKYQLVLTSDERYDYSHAFKVLNGELERGAVVERYTYDDYNGSLQSQYKAQWSEAAQKYLCVYSEDSFNKTEAVLEDKSITFTYYHKNNDDTWVKVQTETQYFEGGDRTGYKIIQYGDDGVTVTNVEAYKQDVIHDSPSAGWTTYVNYDYDAATDTFTPSSKYAEIGKQYSSDNTMTEYGYSAYSYVDGDWQLTYSIIRVILDGHICKITQSNGTRTQVDYVKLDEDNKVIGDITYNDDKSYQVVKDRIYDPDKQIDYALIYYYDANDVLLKTMKKEEGYHTNFKGDSHGSGDDDAYTYYEWKDDQWVPVKEIEVDAGGYSGYKFSIVYTFTDEGYPSVITHYIQSSSYNGGEKFANSKEVYTYSDNGYKLEEYSVWSMSNLTLQLDKCSTYYVLADGSTEVTKVEYDDEKKPGTIYSGSKMVTKEDGSYTYYAYNKKTQAWEVTNTYEAPFQETLYEHPDDYTTIETTRRQGDNGAIINVAKSERYDKSDENKSTHIEASYTWDEANNEWVGVKKYERRVEEIYFGRQYINPIDNYDDEYEPHDVSDPYDHRYRMEASIYYNWDADAKAWKSYIQDDERNSDYSYQIDGNKLSFTTSLTEYGSSQDVVDEIALNSDGYIISETKTTKSTQLESGETREEKVVMTNAFNKYGLIEEAHSDTYVNDVWGDSWYDTYVYEEAQILPTLIEQLPLSSKVEGLDVDGLRIRHEGTILLYNADGRLAGKGNGIAIAPQPGLYVIKTQGQTVKMMLK